MKSFVRTALASVTSCHLKRAGARDVLLYASPRGGSTWMTELIFSLPGFAMASEPLNVRRPFARKQLQIERFGDLYGAAAWTKIEPYYDNILAHRFRQLRPLPGQLFYRPLTWRTVIKENQGGGDHLARIEAIYQCRIIHFLRHPIAVALSREALPLLEDFQNCALREHFTAEQLKFADTVIREGTALERGVLAWCLHHAPALKNQQSTWFVATYEAMVLNPKGVLQRLGAFLGEPEIERLAPLDRPSAVTRKSDSQTQAILGNQKRRGELVSKWQKKVDADALLKVQAILDELAIDLYRADATLPFAKNGILTDCE